LRYTDSTSKLVDARLLFHQSHAGVDTELFIQSLLSEVPAPPRAYTHFSRGIPSSIAYSVDVRIHAAARLTVLNAFMRSGSGYVMSAWPLIP
jgi:hypothetical protein